MMKEEKIERYKDKVKFWTRKMVLKKDEMNNNNNKSQNVKLYLKLKFEK